MPPAASNVTLEKLTQSLGDVAGLQVLLLFGSRAPREALRPAGGLMVGRADASRRPA